MSKIIIKTPRGTISTMQTKSGKVTARLTQSKDAGQKLGDEITTAQEFVDSECLRLMSPLTPRDTGALIKSATLGTKIGSGHIEYMVPYARKQYYDHKDAGAKGRGPLWFERMKTAYKEQILRGAKKWMSQ